MTAIAAAPAMNVFALPDLNPGEHYSGIILDDGKPSYHLVGLPGELESATWDKAVEWAKSIGGELPNLRELGLERVNAANHYQPDLYWSGEQFAGLESWAWCQGFSYGGQYHNHKHLKLRARAVRRIPIE